MDSLLGANCKSCNKVGADKEYKDGEMNELMAEMLETGLYMWEWTRQVYNIGFWIYMAGMYSELQDRLKSTGQFISRHYTQFWITLKFSSVNTSEFRVWHCHPYLKRFTFRDTPVSIV